MDLKPAKLIHGGDLSTASREFGIAKERWIDLSTGISPWSWPVPSVPEIVWQSLPDLGDGLEQVAADYYGLDTSALLPVSGSQDGLQVIPSLLEQGKVAIPVRGYEEHRRAWVNAGHKIVPYQSAEQLQQLVSTRQVAHAVVINPNNPTGEMIDRPLLIRLQQQLQENGGWLLIDEAFMDVLPENSLATECPRPGLIVLRSIGKFFGLAGLRLGFVLAPRALLQELEGQLPPWNVSHPARWIGKRALADDAWCRTQRQRLQSVSGQWHQQLVTQFPSLQFKTSSLFVSGTGQSDLCENIYRELGQRGVLIRVFDEIEGQRMVRFGLPTEEKLPKVLKVLDRMAEEQLCTVG